MSVTTSGLEMALALFSFPNQAQAPSEVPVFEVAPVSSSAKSDVKPSVNIRGKFDKWGAAPTFQSPSVTTGALEISIQPDSVDTGSGMKNGKLKGKDFFDVEHFLAITFKSTKIVVISSEHFEVDDGLTIRGVTNPEKLTPIVFPNDSHLGEIKGKMVFDRKKYGMNKDIPFISIADHGEINIHLKTKRAGSLQLAFQKL
jgi:polyisoprenoid-binding protein YceI